MLYLKKATMDDFEFFYKQKSEDFSIKWGGFETAPEKEKLRNLFSQWANDTEFKFRRIYIIYCGDTPIGSVALIRNEANPKFLEDIAVSVLEEYNGLGLGLMAIKLSIQEARSLGFLRAHGWIREDNYSSIRAYQSCGYVITDKYKEVYIPTIGKNVKMFFTYIEL